MSKVNARSYFLALQDGFSRLGELIREEVNHPLSVTHIVLIYIFAVAALVIAY